MKKLFIVILLIGFGINMSANDWIKINSDQPAPVQVELISSDPESSTIKISFEGFYKKEVQTPMGMAWIPAIEDATLLLEAGSPDLPKVTASVVIPDQGGMAVELLSSQSTSFTDVLIAPSKGNLTRDIDPATVPYQFGEVYSQDAFFPGNMAGTREPHIVRDYRGQTVIFYPFQYNPVTRTLRVYHEMTVKIFKNSDTGTNQLFRQEPVTTIDASFAPIYKNHFLNYNTGSRYNPVEEFGNYLIISHSSFLTEMEDFIAWKKQVGFPVEMVDVSTIGNTAAIKTFIADYYTAKGLTFVLLVGDAAQVPTSSTGAGDSDVNYSYVVGNDHYPDLFIGRFSAENTDHLATQVERTITYEKNPRNDVDRFTLCTGIASSEGPGDDGEYDYQHIRNLQDDLMAYTYTYDNELFDGSQGGNDASGNPSPAQVSEDINDGTSIINYTGHGSTTAWSTSGFNNSNVNSLVNDNMLPFVWSVACVNGNFKNSTCFAETWMRATNNGEPTGAIAFLGSTINQSWNPPMCAQDEMVDILVESYADNINHSFGALSYHGCMLMNDEYGSGGDNMTDTWTCFGDPSLMVRTAVPQDLSVIHDPVLLLGTSQLTIMTAVDGARATLSRDGTILATGVIEGGSLTLSFATLNEVGMATLTVTAYNYMPYIAEIEIIPAEGPFVVLSDFDINDEAGNGNGHADYDELIRLNPEFTNLGPEDASDVTITITTDDQNIIITDNIEMVDNIPANGSVNITDAFEFLVEDNIPDNHTVTCELNMTDGVNEWQSPMQFVLNAPVITIGSITIDDSETGNDNGALDPGETADVTIHYSNSGHTPALNVISNLEAQCGPVDVENPRTVIPMISVFGGTNVTYQVTVDEDSPEGIPAPLYNELLFGGYMVDKTFDEKISPKCEDFETGDFSTFNWNHDGDASWDITFNFPYEGFYSVKSGDISHGESSEINITVNVMKPDAIRFMRKVSSENGDKLKFYVNNQMMGDWSGSNGGWGEESFELNAGVQTLRWIYEKNGNGSGGADCAWLDNIYFPSEMTLTVWAGPGQDVCGNSDVDLNADVTDYSSVEWTTSGTGTFSNTGITNPVYTPNSDDITNGSVNLSITAWDADNNTQEDQLTLLFTDLPGIPTMPYGPDYVNASFTASSLYVTDGLEGAFDYEWYLEPESAGSIISHGSNGIVIWDVSFFGLAYVKVAAINECGEGEASEGFEVTVDNLTGTIENSAFEADMKIMPNPNNGVFRLNLGDGFEGKTNVRVFNLLGSLVYETQVDNAAETGDIQININHVPAGIFMIVAETANNRVTEKIIIK